MEYKNCIEYKSEIINLNEDGRNTSKTISVIPIIEPPYLRLYEPLFISLVCGPVASLIKEFVKRENFFLLVKASPQSIGEFVEALYEDPPDVMLMTGTATQLVYYENSLKAFDLGFRYSGILDYYELGNIAFKISTETMPLFKYFSTFSSEIWILIFISTLVLSYISCLINTNFSQFLGYVWSFNILFVMKTIPKQLLSEKFSQTILLFGWFMGSLILSIYFCALILDSLSRVIPKVIINSWEDLYHKEEVIIIAANDCPLNQFAQSGSYKPEMALSFRSRIDSFEWEKMYNESESIYKRLKSGKFAFIRKKIALMYELKRYSVDYNDKEFLDEMHVSEDGGGFMPFFIPVNKDIDENLLHRLNEMVLISRESGLFWFWTKEIYIQNKLKEQMKESKNSHIYEYKSLKFKPITGVLILCASLTVLSKLVLILEILLFFAKWSAFQSKQQKKVFRRRNEY